MARILLSVYLFLFFNVYAVAGLNISIPDTSVNTSPSGFVYTENKLTIQNGTLSITMQGAPASGLTVPKVVVLRDFSTVRHSSLNWGDTWNLIIASGNYRIIALPVSDGANFYVASSIFISVPPGGVVNQLINYHLM